MVQCMASLNRPPTRALFLDLARRAVEASEAVYGPRLLAAGVFGSVGRGVPRPDSDVDLLLVVEPLVEGRIRRMEEFAEVERGCAPALSEARAQGIATTLSPVIRTPAELAVGSPLMLDMVDDLVILKDPQGVLGEAMDRLRRRLAALGAKRIWRGNAWYWDLKPDYRIGEVFEL
jgi:hypothetical protein